MLALCPGGTRLVRARPVGADQPAVGEALVLVRPVYAEASPSFLAGGRRRRRAAPGSPTPLDAAWCSSRAPESRNPAGGRGRRVRGFAGRVRVLSIGTLRSSHPPEAASWWVASTGSSRRLYAPSGTRERDLACVAGRATGGWSRSPLERELENRHREQDQHRGSPPPRGPPPCASPLRATPQS